MLAGRKLLLADDSVTVQKVIELTFADEGVEVISVGDGEQAIERVEELIPDVVLVDVFMPGFSGYEVCEYIKTSEQLKHIPVMLLVGSFEPFDEAEARRVGANDILTKPFQSIRRLIEKVGVLVSSKPPETEVPTADLPAPPEQVEEVSFSTNAEPTVSSPEVVEFARSLNDESTTPSEADQFSPSIDADEARRWVDTEELSFTREEEARLTTDQLEITTADTRQLPPEVASESFSFEPDFQQTFSENKMDSHYPNSQSESVFDAAETLLDLGDIEPSEPVVADDFELELDDTPAATPAFASTGIPERQSSRSSAGLNVSQRKNVVAVDTPAVSEIGASVADSVGSKVGKEITSSNLPASQSVAGSFNSQELSPELIDAIARRAVEQLSERVVQEIAWEVVPQLAELMIKRQLEERESQAK